MNKLNDKLEVYDIEDTEAEIKEDVSVSSIIKPQETMQELIDYEKEFARKLLTSVRQLADIRNVKVKSPTSNSMETVNLHQWYTWLHKRLELHVGYGLEEDFIKIIDLINNRNLLLLDEAELSIVKILSVADKLESVIKDKNSEIKRLSQKLEESGINISSQGNPDSANEENESKDAEDVDANTPQLDTEKPKKTYPFQRGKKKN